AYRFGGLSVGEVLDKLHEGDECQPPGCPGRASSTGIDCGKVLIRKQRPQFLTHSEIDITAWECSFGDTLGQFRDRFDGLRTKRHRKAPSKGKNRAILPRYSTALNLPTVSVPFRAISARSLKTPRMRPL